MCTGYSNHFQEAKAQMDAQESKMFHESGFPEMSVVGPMLLKDIQNSTIAGVPAAGDIQDISVVVRNIGNFSAPGSDFGRTSDAVKITTKSGPAVYAAVGFSAGRIVSVRALKPRDLFPPYGFAREMAAYMLLNDLLASDTTIPRDGCVNAVKVQTGSMPGIIPELTAAMTAVPANDSKSLSAALQAYRQFTRARETKSNKLTQQTIARLTNSPDVSFVYRDADTTLGFGPEIDVVRLSKGPLRTYAMLMTVNGVSRMSSPALCFVGNKQCGNYYVWP